MSPNGREWSFTMSLDQEDMARNAASSAINVWYVGVKNDHSNESPDHLHFSKASTDKAKTQDFQAEMEEGEIQESSLFVESDVEEYSPEMSENSRLHFGDNFCKPGIVPHANAARTSSSKRTRSAKITFGRTASATVATSRKQRARQYKKLKKLFKLGTVNVGPKQITLDELKNSVHTYFRFVAQRESEVGNVPEPLRFLTGQGNFRTCLYNENHFTIVNRNTGAYFVSDKDERQMVFVLVPRENSLGSIGKLAETDIEMMMAYQKDATSVRRGKAHVAHMSGKYCNPGFKANRGGRGIIASHHFHVTSEKFQPYMDDLTNLSRRCEKLMSEFLKSNDLRGMGAVQRVAPFKTLSGSSETGLFAAAAMACNYSSAAHIDDDFYYSMLCVRSADRSPPSKKNRLPFKCNYEQSPAPVYHFIFPTFGIAVALRPGDNLIFNPRIVHCCSEKLLGYETHDAHICSFYIKTAVIGGNDNKIPLTLLQERMLELSV